MIFQNSSRILTEKADKNKVGFFEDFFLFTLAPNLCGDRIKSDDVLLCVVFNFGLRFASFYCKDFQVPPGITGLGV
jgi:hypothetical protein